MARKTNKGYVPTGRISFTIEDIDNGDNFNLASGTYKVPIDGVYFFTFNGWIRTKNHTRIRLYVNGSALRTFVDGHTDGHWGRQVSFSTSLKLKARDKINLLNENSSSIYCDHDQNITFLGYRIPYKKCNFNSH